MTPPAPPARSERKRDPEGGRRAKAASQSTAACRMSMSMCRRSATCRLPVPARGSLNSLRRVLRPAGPRCLPRMTKPLRGGRRPANRRDGSHPCGAGLLRARKALTPRTPLSRPASRRLARWRTSEVSQAGIDWEVVPAERPLWLVGHYLTTRTGIELLESTSEVWLPSSRRRIPRRPCEAMTMRLQSRLPAVSTIASAG
jgi:hypothetical protein